MSSFFSIPKKRSKPSEPSSSTTVPPRKKQQQAQQQAPARPPKKSRVEKKDDNDDESISGSDSGDERGPDATLEVDLDEGDHAQETEEQRRVRLAETYLKSTIENTALPEDGFDAVDVDREILDARFEDGERFNRKYITYKRRTGLAEKLDFAKADTTFFSGAENSESVTAVALYWPYLYTASKDIVVAKYKLPACPFAERKSHRRKPKLLYSKRGSRYEVKNREYLGHGAAILCMAIHPNGETLATGGEDKKIVLWNTFDLTPTRVFPQHRAPIYSLSFRPQSGQLFSASADRTVKVWIVSPEVTGYVETLFGHADTVVNIAALPGEREMCVSVGGRDRTARVWKVIEEEQLVFRAATGKDYRDGSLDVVTPYDGSTFVTGGDGGVLSLCNLGKKKPLASLTAVHGLDIETQLVSALEQDDGTLELTEVAKRPRWITSLATLSNTDLIFSGSWDGSIKALRIEEGDKGRRSMSIVHTIGTRFGDIASTPIRGIINDLAAIEYSNTELEDSDEDTADEDETEEGDAEGEAERYEIKDPGGVIILAGVGKTPRLGRWFDLQAKGIKPSPRNGAYLVWIPYKDSQLHNGTNGTLDHDMGDA